MAIIGQNSYQLPSGIKPDPSKVGSGLKTSSPETAKGEKPAEKDPEFERDQIRLGEGTSLNQGSPLKKPRPGSDMALMLEDFERNGLLDQVPVSDQRSEELPKLKTPRAGSDMAQMLEDIQQSGFVGQATVGANGAIALIEDPYIEQQPGHHSQHHHGHGQTENGLLGGHLGTELVEQIGHKAHHAAEHLGHHVAESVSHGVVKATAKGASEAVGKSAGEVAGKSASELAGAKSELLGEGLTAVHHGKLGATEAVQQTTEVAGHLGTAMTTALGVASAASGILAIPLTYIGAKELSHGIKEKNTDKVLEGVGNVAVGVRSAAASTVMAGMISTSEVVGQVAALGYKTLTPLGLVHAGVDAYLGIKDIAKGKRTEGSLKLGFGLAVGTAALGGGVPAVVAAICFLGAKVGHKIAKGRAQAKEVAQQNQPAKEILPDPAVFSDPYAALSSKGAAP